jgi:hypothetical protein
MAEQFGTTVSESGCDLNIKNIEGGNLHGIGTTGATR